MKPNDTDLIRRNQRTGLIVMAVIIGMIALSFASVPLYRMFCEATGLGGRAFQSAKPSGEIIDREVTVRFDTDTDPNLPWTFKPTVPFVKVKIGQEAIISFEARNDSNQPVAGTAIYDINPGPAGVYFNKTQCFCFDYQMIAPGKTAQFPVVFYIDPKFAKDRELESVKTITLSYTFFKADSKELEAALSAFSADGKSANKSVPMN